MKRKLVVLWSALLAVTLVFAQETQKPITFETVEALRQEARRIYPTGFVDLAPWKKALEAAQALASQNPNDPRALRLLAELYTETQWAIRAWEAWMNYREKGGTWDEAARSAAAKVARTLAFYANQRKDKAEAERWVAQAEAVESGR
ncbi:MAG: hypothetical protein C4298_02270 [Thermus sp.]|uniref:hypothetical protein n=1 Tax=Thermus sp. TaxID=275 RepID=UPI0033292564